MIRGKFLTSMEDTSAVFSLRKEIFADEFGIALDRQPDQYDTMAIYALVFSEDGKNAGMGRLYIDECDRFVIDQVGVLAGMRAQKIGDLIMRMLLFRVQEMALPSVYALTFPESAPFFLRYGFTPDGKVDFKGKTLLRMVVSGDDISIAGTCQDHAGCENCAGNCAGAGQNSAF